MNNLAAAAPPLLELEGVSKRFVTPLDAAETVANWLGARRRPQVVHAVEDVSLSIRAGEVLGLVGESGCGKSTLARIVSGILAPTAGFVRQAGRDRATLRGPERRRADLAIQMVFQDPMSSLNPRMRAGAIIGEAIGVHRIVPPDAVDGEVARLMREVGLDPSARDRFPHQFSGGQRARIGIARALGVRPEVLVCDEATAALDVSIQAQVVNLLADLRRERGLALLFVSHDLGIVRHVSDRVAVMYLGRIVETASTDRLFGDEDAPAANHPYTQALLAEAPRLEAVKKRFTPLKGELPSPLAPPSGCHFHPRCPHAFAPCRTVRPALREVAFGHWSACHLNDAPRSASPISGAG